MANKLVEDLKKRGDHFSAYVQSGVVVFIGPGAPWTTIPTMYEINDFNGAIEDGSLKHMTWTVSGAGKTWSFESFVPA